jgi:hypothetical protein
MLTAAHCFSDSQSALGTNTVDGAPIVRVSFDPDLLNTVVTNPDQEVWHYGTYYFDPQFAMGASGGLPGFATHDVAVIVFGSPGCTVPEGASGMSTCGPVTDVGSFGALPPEGLVGTLKNNTPVDIVGYGDQNFIRGGGPCKDPQTGKGNCKPREGDAFTRFAGQTTLIASNDRISGAFMKLHSNNSGTCFGDSGGPDLLGGTNTVLAVNSFVANGICAGNTYSYRVDTPEARAFLSQFITLP